MYVSDKFGMLQGFGWKMYKNKAAAGWVVREGMKWVLDHRRTRKKYPFFLYLHFMDVHESAAGRAFKQMYYNDALTGRASPLQNLGFEKGRGLGTPQFKLWKNMSIARYDASIAYVDNYIGDFIDFAREEGIYGKTIFVLLADHGEEFWDHVDVELKKIEISSKKRYGVRHGHTLFHELVDVPLIIAGPKIKPRTDTALAVNLDVAPTLLSAVKASAGPFLKEGRDLLKKKKPSDKNGRLAFSESIAYGYEAKALRNERFKLIKSKNYTFFFDKQRDPLEKMDLGLRYPEERATLARSLDKLLARIVVNEKAPPVDLDDDMKQQLQALGYLD